MDKENHSVFIPDDIGLTKGTNLIGDGSYNRNSTSLIWWMGGNSRPPDARDAAVVLRGRRVVKKTYMRSKLPKNAMDSPGGGFVEEGTPAFIDDGESASKQGEEGTPAFSL